MAEGHAHGAGASSKRLMWALVLTTTFLIAEVVGAVVFKSLALLSDAAHMFTDVAALAIALAAIKIGERPADSVRTFGYRRFEILAAAFNAVLLFLVAGYVLYEGVLRLFAPEPVGSVGMLVVASLGLVVNLVSMRLLASGANASLNVKGAYLEVWADMLGSVGVIGGAVLIMLTGWAWIDPVVAIGIGLWVLPRTWMLLKNTTHILLEGVPKDLSLEAVRATIAAVPGVAEVHDLHLWGVSSDDVNGSVHLVLAEGWDAERVRRAVLAQMNDVHGIDHAAVQIESGPAGEGEALGHGRIAHP
ncbi:MULTISPECIES: cation diffusion facilitator family transporter [Brevundimonas]|jgi:cobalt-zinc-cadmium efflux system protein|uniref:Cation transporter n=1 Tax=Brevundimonas pondensis TaxID=2774189 RepID=A0ABX7SMY8_9CAUL|nr:MULTISPECIES: cation diffusion facilitator family transporter [Brevundimonas]NWE52818.1 cation transporter [Brevundimonas sp. P7753]QTC88724.1 cation transporter [Brevundimonas pondensis]